MLSGRIVQRVAEKTGLDDASCVTMTRPNFRPPHGIVTLNGKELNGAFGTCIVPVPYTVAITHL